MDKTLLDFETKQWLGSADNEPTLCAVSFVSTIGIHHARVAFGEHYVYVNSDAYHNLDTEAIASAIKAVAPKRAKSKHATINNDESTGE